MQSKSHACPPWTVRAWPPLLWQVDNLRPLLLRHLGTRVTNPGDQVSRTAGQTIWAALGCQVPRPQSKERSGPMEIIFFIGAFVLLAALIFGVLQYRYRNRAAVRAGGEIVKERYRRDES